jgi:hypothetical protein
MHPDSHVSPSGHLTGYTSSNYLNNLNAAEKRPGKDICTPCKRNVLDATPPQDRSFVATHPAQLCSNYACIDLQQQPG